MIPISKRVASKYDIGPTLEQTKQASSDAAQAASDKAVPAKDGAASYLEQAGNALSNAMQSVTNAVPPRSRCTELVYVGRYVAYCCL